MKQPHRRPTTGWTMLIAALPIALVVAVAARPPVASATHLHLRLLRSAPSADSVVTAPPEEIRLWFSAAPEVKVTRVELRRGEEEVEVGTVKASEDDPTVLYAPLDEPAGPGRYTVEWRTMARDGHVVSGEFGFRVEVTR